MEVIAPSGKRSRWSPQEPDPADSFSGLHFSSTAPGGHEQLDSTLARRAQLAYADLTEFAEVIVRGAGGRIAWQGRLERSPRTSGDAASVQPAAVGWIAHLDDNKTAREIYVDVDLSRWRGPSVEERIARAVAATYAPTDPTTVPSPAGTPSLALEQNGPWAVGAQPLVEAFYDAGPGINIGKLYYAATKNATINAADVAWGWDTLLASTDVGGAGDTSGNLRSASPVTGTLAATADRRYAAARLYYTSSPAGANNNIYAVYWFLAVYGDHDLDLYGTADATNAQGVLASDVVQHAVRKWAPLLDVDSGTIDATGFVIPHLAFPDPTTASEIVKQATRFGLEDWAVWDKRRFHLHARGTYGRRWRARVGPAQLQETGPQADRIWNSIVVQYTDPAGTTLTVGPPGSGCDTEDDSLQDDDPQNPANQLGIDRRDMLVMGTSVGPAAIEVGRRFLEQTKLLDTSGQAQLVGHVLDDRGVMHPAWAVRAGDAIAFVDAASPGDRRVIRADYADDTKTCTVDLDAPPDALQQLLERLGVSLVSLGLGS